LGPIAGLQIHGSGKCPGPCNQYRPMLARSYHASELQALMHVVAIMSREAIKARPCAAMLRPGEWFRQLEQIFRLPDLMPPNRRKSQFW
jgi:hypothetical protein